MSLSFDIQPILAGQQRLDATQALELLQSPSLHELGQYAQVVTKRLRPEPHRTYVIDRNINYTNICSAKCSFCAFKRTANAADAYTLPFDAIEKKIQELVSIGGTQILMQGGMNPNLPLDYYTTLLQSIKQKFPGVHVHSFSPPEFVEFEKYFGKDIRDLLVIFKQAGLDTIPGGGGEIFHPRVRAKIGIGKCDANDWMRIMRVAHESGMDTSATMLIGHIEFLADRIHHMQCIRDMQDYALAMQLKHKGQLTNPLHQTLPRFIENPDQTLTQIREKYPKIFGKSEFTAQSIPARFGAYTAFIHWPFQRQNTPLGKAKEWTVENYGPFDDSTNPEILAGRVIRSSSADDYLRTLAVARLFLDNIPSLQSSWVTMGPKVGQLALFFGANDMGSVMMEENVVSAAGTTYKLNEDEIVRLIHSAGWKAAQRDQHYNVLKTM